MAAKKENPKNSSSALSTVVAQIQKQYGEGAIVKLGDATANAKIESISTGALTVDIALGIGGLPKGRIVEIYGPESSGKTTLVSHVIANAQKAGGSAAFIDTEHALDPGYAKKIGVDIDNLLVSQPDSGEEALNICEALVKSNSLDVIVVDSVAALAPRAELDGEMGQSHVGLQARLMSQALRKLVAAISHSSCIVIFTNQIREKVGVMFGSPETTRRRSRPKVLFLRSPGHPPHWPVEGFCRRCVRQPHPHQSGKEQGRPAVHAGGVRYSLRGRHLLHRFGDRCRDRCRHH